MRTLGMKRILALAVGLLAMLGALSLTSTPASALAGGGVPTHGFHTVRLHFDVKNERAVMRVPTPKCPSESPCAWLLIINEPKLSPQVVGEAVCCEAGVDEVYVSWPREFEGIIQADALISVEQFTNGHATAGPWTYVTGARHYINTLTNPCTGTSCPCVTNCPCTGTSCPCTGTSCPCTGSSCHCTGTSCGSGGGGGGGGSGNSGSGGGSGQVLPFTGSSGSGHGRNTVHTLTIHHRNGSLPYTQGKHHKTGSSTASTSSVQPSNFWSNGGLALILILLALALLGGWLLLGKRRRDEDGAAPA